MNKTDKIVEVIENECEHKYERLDTFVDTIKTNNNGMVSELSRFNYIERCKNCGGLKRTTV